MEIILAMVFQFNATPVLVRIGGLLTTLLTILMAAHLAVMAHIPDCFSMII
jgi:hypothetical protein